MSKQSLFLQLVLLLFCFPLTATYAQKTPTKGKKQPPKARNHKPTLQKSIIQPPTLTLIQPGKAPHAPLRYQFSKGGSIKLVMDIHVTMQITITMKQGTQTTPKMKSPPVRISLALQHTKADAKGQVQVRGRIQKISLEESKRLPPRILSQMRKELQKLRDIQLSYTLDSRGFVTNRQLKVPSGLSSQIRQVTNNLRQSLRQMVIPLPKKPIGIGALWKVKTEYKKPVRLTQITTYVLQKQEKGQIQVRIRVIQLAPQQTIRASTPMGVVNNRIDAMQVSGQGGSTFSLRKFSINTKNRVKSEMHMTVTAQQQTRKMQMMMDIKSHIHTQ